MNYGNFSQITFDSNRNIQQLLFEQGRLVTDAQLNELSAIYSHELRLLNQQIFPSGGTGEDDAFKVSAPAIAGEAKVKLGQGNYFVDGLRISNPPTESSDAENEWPLWNSKGKKLNTPPVASDAILVRCWQASVESNTLSVLPDIGKRIVNRWRLEVHKDFDNSNNSEQQVPRINLRELNETIFPNGFTGICRIEIDKQKLVDDSLSTVLKFSLDNGTRMVEITRIEKLEQTNNDLSVVYVNDKSDLTNTTLEWIDENAPPREPGQLVHIVGRGNKPDSWIVSNIDESLHEPFKGQNFRVWAGYGRINQFFMDQDEIDNALVGDYITFVVVDSQIQNVDSMSFARPIESKALLAAVDDNGLYKDKRIILDVSNKSPAGGQ